MSDYRDIVRESIDKGFYLDSCGSPERYYTWGSWIDLCGMSIEDAKAAPDAGMNGGGGSGDGGGSDTAKTKNTITFLMQQGTDNEYSLYLTTSYAPTQDVVVSFSMDGEMHLVTIPAGTTTLNTGIKGEDPAKPYANISGAVVNSDDEQYTYSTKNNVKTGIFTLTVIKDGVKTVEQVKYDTPVELVAPEEKEGYDFIWKDSAGNEIDADSFVMPESNTTITGEYVAKEYTLTYIIYKERLNGGSVDPEIVESGDTVVKFGTKLSSVLPAVNVEDGYELSGWGVPSDATMPASDTELSNTYRLKKYTLKYVADGTVISEHSLYYTENTVTETIPDKTGYNTIGWDTEIPQTMPARNITANAVYEAIIYHIRWFVDGVEKYVEEHIYGDAISGKPDEVKEGYTFSGWDTVLPPTMPDSDIEVRGTFTINKYTFRLLVDGEVYFEKEYEYGEPINKDEIQGPEKEGYTFVGWEPEIPETVPANDLEISAKFQINSYEIRYYVDDELYSSFTQEYGTEIVEIAEPSKEGHAFSGWGEHPQTVPAGDVEIRGTFSINSYLLSYYVDGVLAESAVTEYDAEITHREEPSKEGYTFSGWDAEPERMPAHDVDVNGTFSINSYLLSYYVDGSVISEESVEYGSTLTEMEHPTLEGHTFSGWTNVPVTMPAEDVRVDGWFNVNQYTLSFVLDGEPYTSITQDYGTDVPVVPVPERTGYTFSGWDKEIPQTIPAEDIEFSGTMEINVWTATYYIDGEQYSSVTYEYGAQIDYPTVPKEGYELKWTVEYETMPDNDITINGVYEEHVAPKTIYYGAVLAGTESNVTSGLSSFEYENGVQVTTPFVIPADPAYDELETDEDFEEWEATHMFDYYILVPSGLELTFKNAANKVKRMDPKGTVSIGVDEYTQYYSPATTSTSESSTFNMKITITEI